MASTWYTVLYARPFEHGMDDRVLATHVHGDWWIQVTTLARQCRSWKAAHEAAIALMRDADARRQSG